MIKINNDTKEAIAAIITVILILVSLMYIGLNYKKKKIEACQKAGFDSYSGSLGMIYCTYNNGTYRTITNIAHNSILPKYEFKNITIQSYTK